MIQRAAHLVIGSAAAAFDRAASFAANAQIAGRRRKNPNESLGHEQRLQVLAMLADVYRSQAETTYFREPRAITPVQRVVRARAASRVIDLCWSSDYVPFLPDTAERYGRHIENHVAAARLFVSAVPRPIAILVHGYMAGHFALEQRVWPVDWLHRIGFDVALFVLPFHGVRANPARRLPPFPGSDPRVSNEGFRQTMADLRDFVCWLKQRGHPQIGIMGMSLGGYATALAATVEPELAFAVPILPLASLADWARDQGRLGTTPEQTALQYRALDAVHEVISPLHRQPLLAPERLLVIAGKADRITPMSHALRLSRHFRAPLETMPGGHLLQVGRTQSFRRIGRLLQELGLVTAEAS